MHFNLFFLVIFLFNVSLGQIFVPTTQSVVDGNVTSYNYGDTLFLDGGLRNRITIKNFNGITVINKDSVVEIVSNQFVGIKLMNCQNIKITGSGTANTYGFVIESNDLGIQFTDTSNYVEIERCEIRNCNLGILGKSNLDRSEFTQYNTHVHHNYIHHIGTEGIYLGSSFYATSTEHLLDGVRVHHNIVDSTGWDGIQVGSASFNCKVFNNTITNDSYKRQASQMSGIMLNPGSKCDCYNNWIQDGRGSGIFDQGLGENRIYNNIIINPGVGGDSTRPRGDDGISIWGLNRPYSSGNSIYVFHNTIINPMNNGVTFAYDPTLQGDSSKIFNNLIVSPNGSYFTADTTKKYIEPSFGAKYLDTGNYFLSSIDTSVFVDVLSLDFHLKNSIIVNTSIDMGFVESNYDFDSVFRLGGRSPGAYHYNLLTTKIQAQTNDKFYKILNDRIYFNNYYNEPIYIYRLNGELYKRSFISKELIFSSFPKGVYILSVPIAGVSFKLINP